MRIDLKTTAGHKSAKNINIENLPDVVIFSGINGAGKTHLFEGIKSGKIQLLRDGQVISKENIQLFTPPFNLNQGSSSKDYFEDSAKEAATQLHQLKSGNSRESNSQLIARLKSQNPQAPAANEIERIAKILDVGIDEITAKDFEDFYSLPEGNRGTNTKLALTFPPTLSRSEVES